MKGGTMDPAKAIILGAMSRQKKMNDVIDRGDTAVQQFYSGAVVFVTGGSGFLGKQLIEKLFRSCNINKLYMLMRPKKGKTVQERFAKELKDPVYETLHEKKPGFGDRIVPILGDVAEIDIGISDKDRERLVEEVDVIFHVAANVTFDAPLRSATLTNVRGTRDMISLAKQCKKLRSFIYISTAYSHATYSRRDSEVLEQFYPSPVPPQLMIQLAESVDEQRLNDTQNGLIQDWPNTYSFTKALAEELIRTSEDLPICILRPSIVICTNREPSPGYIHSVFGPTGLIFGTTMGVVHVIHSSKQIKIDLVPADYVINSAIVAAAKERRKQIYNIGSSCRNPITWGQLSTILREVVRPSLISPKAMWNCFVIETPYKWVYTFLSCLFHQVPAYGVDGVCMVFGVPPRLRTLYSTIEKMSSVFTYYTNNEWIFNDSNTFELYKSLSEEDKAIYSCDIADVGWTEQISLWSVGLRKYIVKDGLNNTEWGIRKQQYFLIATYVISGLFIYFVWLLLVLILSFTN